MERSLLITLLLIIVLTTTSCTTDSTIPGDTEVSKVTQEVINIDELPPEVTESEYIDPIENLELYPIADCEFAVEGNHVEACYDDGLYAIDYNFNFYDYDVSYVSTFSAIRGINSISANSLPDGWSRARLIDTLFIRDWERDEHFPEECSYATTIVDSADVVSIESVDRITPIYEIYNNDVDIFPYAISYDYTSDEFVSLSNLVGLYSLTGNDLLVNSENGSETDSFTRYVLREELYGLPICVQDNNVTFQNRVHFNDLYGSLPNYSRTYAETTDFYYGNETIYVDYVGSGLEEITCEGDWYPVCSAESCLNNTISPLIHEMLNGHPCNHAYVYYSELLYIPFGVNYIHIATFDYETKLVPVWAFYYFADYEGQIRETGAVYINAISGESVTRVMRLPEQ